MDLKKLFGISTKGQKEDSELGELFAGIRPILEGYTADDIKLITGFAGLLGKVAYADMEISDVEIARIRAVLEKRLNLKHHQIEPIIKLLGEHKARLFSVEDYIYIRLLDTVFNHSEKINLLRALFTVAAADESVSAEEDAVLWTVAKGLKLSHRDFVKVRAEFKEHLDVLK
ncbi:MAG: TerB family tellurite resistance protein [Deltaproteobacteria bacterium]|nr:TerB family tellurite resistance protein [Deltaproteobacteria bacterium]